MSERKGLEKNISVPVVMAVAIIPSSLLLVPVSLWAKKHLVTALLDVVRVLSLVYTVARHSYEKNLSSTKPAKENLVLACEKGRTNKVPLYMSDDSF